MHRTFAIKTIFFLYTAHGTSAVRHDSWLSVCITLPAHCSCLHDQLFSHLLSAFRPSYHAWLLSLILCLYLPCHSIQLTLVPLHIFSIYSILSHLITCTLPPTMPCMVVNSCTIRTLAFLKHGMVLCHFWLGMCGLLLPAYTHSHLILRQGRQEGRDRRRNRDGQDLEILVRRGGGHLQCAMLLDSDGAVPVPWATWWHVLGTGRTDTFWRLCGSALP